MTEPNSTRAKLSAAFARQGAIAPQAMQSGGRSPAAGGVSSTKREFAVLNEAGAGSSKGGGGGGDAGDKGESSGNGGRRDSTEPVGGPLWAAGGQEKDAIAAVRGERPKHQGFAGGNGSGAETGRSQRNTFHPGGRRRTF